MIWDGLAPWRPYWLFVAMACQLKWTAQGSRALMAFPSFSLNANAWSLKLLG